MIYINDIDIDIFVPILPLCCQVAAMELEFDVSGANCLSSVMSLANFNSELASST